MSGNVLAICGSTRLGSASASLIQYLAHDTDQVITPFISLDKLPPFDPNHPDLLLQKHTEATHQLKTARSLLINTPEYLHSIPATLKSLLEWTNGASLLAEIRIVSIVYTPVAPRGRFAKNHLEDILKALNTNHILSELIHHTDLAFDTNGKLRHNHIPELLSGVKEIL